MAEILVVGLIVGDALPLVDIRLVSIMCSDMHY
jgi:hypothetical protein